MLHCTATEQVRVDSKLNCPPSARELLKLLVLCIGFMLLENYQTVMDRGLSAHCLCAGAYNKGMAFKTDLRKKLLDLPCVRDAKCGGA